MSSALRSSAASPSPSHHHNHDLPQPDVPSDLPEDNEGSASVPSSPHSSQYDSPDSQWESADDDVDDEADLYPDSNEAGNVSRSSDDQSAAFVLAPASPVLEPPERTRSRDRSKKRHAQAALIDRQKDLRKQIVDIQNDDGLDAATKAKRIQNLMSSSYTKSLYTNIAALGEVNGLASDSNAVMANASLDPSSENFGILRPEDRIRTWHDRDAQILGCKHYQRGARLQARCCGKWFTCRFCHDEVSDHTLNRTQTTTMLCMHCLHPQPAAQMCAQCSEVLSRYYCTVCKLWDDDRTKSIYHCADCGICRIGRGLGLDYFHCQRCNACMAIGLDGGNHRCIERNLECDCPICGEYMFTSTSTVIFMPCGHCIHHACHQTYIQTSYQCPTCFKSLAVMTDYFRRIDAMLEQHTMPPEYANMVTHILCNDCEKRSTAKYHFLYHACGSCKGYNTKVLSVDQGTGPPTEGEATEALEEAEGSVNGMEDARNNLEPDEEVEQLPG